MELCLPPPVWRALRLLEENGYAAYAVGGCVRDRLRGEEPHDWDIATSARPEQIAGSFAGCAQVIPTGLQHGTVTLLLDGWTLEATTFRVDGPYTDRRRPDSVAFTSDLEADLARRDFTINAMAYSPWRGLADPFGGRRDLAGRRLRCVGTPVLRFREDALRILRGLRFLSQLGFSMEEETGEALLACRELLRSVSAERLAAETGRLFCGPHAGRVLRAYRQVLTVFLPELLPSMQSGAWESAVQAAEALPPVLELRWAALLGGMSGPARMGAADGLLRRLRLDNRTRERIIFLFQNGENAIPADAASVRRQLYQAGEERFRLLLTFWRGLHAGEESHLAQLDAAERAMEEALAGGMPLSLHGLAVSGRDLLALGLPAGPQVGRLLETLLNQVLEGTADNHRETLLHLAEKQWKKGL
ncbi:MAG: tRNA nucleotidyltransferase [Provencibacterium sp.]|jgi:tRNA nucleotidyltransferase (CCA-adding enzyme)|nr:tRNA nucleotidyltransferase [Provencibacterium sp.]